MCLSCLCVEVFLLLFDSDKMTRIKICGITNAEDAECAARCGADALGFVFAESPRRVEPSRARAILAEVEPFITGVGVFVNSTLAEVRDTLATTGCTVAQLHGEEGAGLLDSLVPFAAMKVFHVRDQLDEQQLLPFRRARAILLDTFVPGRSGGTGQQFDHRLVADLIQRGWRIVIAGGLTPDNVYDVVRTVRPYGVDVSSGVEAAPGRKDHHMIEDFVAAVREADGVGEDR